MGSDVLRTRTFKAQGFRWRHPEDQVIGARSRVKVRLIVGVGGYAAIDAGMAGRQVLLMLGGAGE